MTYGDDTIDILALRDGLGLSQLHVARRYGVTVARWEFPAFKARAKTRMIRCADLEPGMIVQGAAARPTGK